MSNNNRMMKNLIYITGDITKTFFTNEIGYFCQNFDNVYVFAYKGDPHQAQKLSEKYGFQYKLLNFRHLSIKSLKLYRNINQEEFVRTEKHTRKLKGIHEIKRKLYIDLYVLFLSIFYQYIQDVLDYGGDIYVYSFWLSRPAFISGYLKYKYNLRNVVTRTHRYDLYEEENELNYLPFRRFITENIDTLYFSSMDSFEYFYKKKYSPINKYPAYKLSYLGTEKSIWHKCKKNSDRLVVASCSAVIPRKRLDLIVNTIKYLSDFSEIPIHWIHIGGGNQMREVTDLCREQLRDISYELIGNVQGSEIYEIYEKNNVDFFINMSDSEGIPVSVIEALSMGIPIIIRNVGGNLDAVTNGQNGIVINEEVTNSTCKLVARKILDLYSNDSLYNQHSENAILTWQRKFDANKNIQEICSDILDPTNMERIEI